MQQLVDDHRRLHKAAKRAQGKSGRQHVSGVAAGDGVAATGAARGVDHRRRPHALGSQADEGVPNAAALAKRDQRGAATRALAQKPGEAG